MSTSLPDVPVRSLQDILTALERHPEWRAALRQQILGEELLELPALFARFATETTRRLDVLTEDLASFKATTNERLDRLTADVGSLKADVGTLKADVGSLKADVGTLKNDVGSLKGAHAETKARVSIAVIADELDLEHRRIVPGIELRRLARHIGADLRDDAIKSFVASDIIAETIDAKGNTTYLAVEASYTGDLHDADRAQSHAALMQRFTNKPCRAVVASARNNDRLRELIDSGKVAWHQLQVRIQPAS